MFDTPAEWPDGSRVQVSLIAPESDRGNGQGEPPPGVRKEFLDAMRVRLITNESAETNHDIVVAQVFAVDSGYNILPKHGRRIWFTPTR